MYAYGMTESGKTCRFQFQLGAIFKPGAGIAPTHGGFLMCGMDNDTSSSRRGVFSVILNIFIITLLLFFNIYIFFSFGAYYFILYNI